MKKLLIYAIFGTTLLVMSCNDDFLQNNPATSITADQFFKTPGDLETYTNGFYSQLRFDYNDVGSDNISIYTGGAEIDQVLTNTVTPGNVGGWEKDDWAQLRSINFMMSRLGQVEGSQEEIDHFIGIARFFRAWFYIEKVKRYSDVPWYSVDLTDADEELLYKTQDPRALVVDSIMADLEFASAHVMVGTDRTRITKWAALALLSRFALYEGTFRKYHPELGLTATANEFLEKAVSASFEIMDSGVFSIYSTGKGGEDYRQLFTSQNLANNNEMILWADYDQELGVGNNAHTVLDWQWALSKSLADSYLMKDGTPFTSVPDFDEKAFVEVFEDRDPRMASTIMYPGFITTSDGEPYRIKPNFGGYLQIKFYPPEELRSGWEANYSDLPILRYAEVLLNYAEAKAELGALAQEDLDKSINLLRSRVNMPDLTLAHADANPDPILMDSYPNVSGAHVGTLLEIRRERRVELACEGFRYTDLMRWHAGKLLDGGQEGMYVPALGAMDVTGDGEPDIAILEAQGEEGPIAGLPDNVKENLSLYYLENPDGSAQSFYLSEGDFGFIKFRKYQDNPPLFEEPKDYYRPVPQQQLTLNPNLRQNEFWK